MRHPIPTGPFDTDATPIESFEEAVQNAARGLDERYAVTEAPLRAAAVRGGVEETPKVVGAPPPGPASLQAPSETTDHNGLTPDPLGRRGPAVGAERPPPGAFPVALPMQTELTSATQLSLTGGQTSMPVRPKQGPTHTPQRRTTSARSMSRPIAEAPRFKRASVEIVQADATSVYAEWPQPTAIVVDGPYGVAGFPGDPPTPADLAAWYRPHVEAWSRYATPMTTLWFWNTEVGWATVHPVLVEHGWEYVGCNIWNKGIAHIAGNCNTQTLRKFPIVTEVCVQYVKPARFEINGRLASMKEWLRWEWQRAELPLALTNEACGVRNAATRKYFTQDHVWYFPPVEAMVRLVEYANRHGVPSGRPYFSLDGRNPVSADQWSRMRSKFHLQAGITNVWDEPALRGEERIKVDRGLGHPNQKPLKLIERIIEASTDRGDVVWEPFGGLCTGAIASFHLGRQCYSAEILPGYYDKAVDRLRRARNVLRLF